MSNLLGTQVAASIVPFDSEDTYATHESRYGKGGWHAVTSIQERNLIPVDRRETGMVCYVQDTDEVYLLKGGIDNNCWVALKSGSSSYVHIQGIASAVWMIPHNMNKYPAVTVVDSAENQVIGDIEYIDANNVMVTFTGAFKGKAYCN